MKIFLIIFGVIILLLMSVGFATSQAALISPTDQIFSTNLPEPTPLIGQPNLLIIPKLSVSTNIESVGIDTLGNMDVPKNADQVGWYNLGYKPGQVGSAVLAGHLDRADGSPAVFYHLNQLQPGDEIQIIDQYQQKYIYQVTEIKSYQSDQFPLTEIFASEDQKRLNLITCSGQFNQQNRNYSHRTVVKAIEKKVN